MTSQPLAFEVRAVFGERLAVLMGGGYERREQQSRMSAAVAGLIDTGGVAVMEAGTGLGKSLAYLVPLVLHCARQGSRVVVSTYTRNLQRQLIEKDFPLACKAAGAGVNGVSLMGRGNYICRRRAEAKARGPGADANTTATVRRWLRSALGDESGAVDTIAGASRHLDASLRTSIVSPSRDSVCAGCGVRHDCFMLAARRRALDAQLVVTNHALLFSDVSVSGSLLGPYDVLVVDEAHHLEDVATDFFSITFSPRSLTGSANSLYTPELEETARYVRAMVESESPDHVRDVDEIWKRFRDALDDAGENTAALFRLLGKNAPRPRPSKAGATLTYAEGSPLMYGAEGATSGVSRALGRMESAAASLLELAEAAGVVEEGGAAGAVRAIRDLAAETRSEFNFLASASADDHVFYAQLDGEAGIASLKASPVDVGDRLGSLLVEGGKTVVLTSATLAVDGDFSFILNSLGLDGGVASTSRFGSPFDLDERRLVLQPDYLPDPSSDAFLGEAAALIDDAVAVTGRRALVLCTSRAQVSGLGRLLVPGRGEVLLQEAGASREDLLERFRQSKRGVLVGLASFWEGIDLPGDDLELLIILKLPFLVPSQPVAQARAQRVERTGENPFEKLFLPDVVLKLRQGMGRLIRTGRDRGVVLLLDRRLTHGRYGEFVLNSITNRFVRCARREEALERLERYFQSHGKD
jgi:Rad3-related DNA helicase